jgi:hypothetical protein
MQQAIPDDVERVFATITHTYGATFSLSDIIRLIEHQRGKPLRVEDDRMPVGMTAYCIALQDVDLICTRARMDPLLRRVAQLHEMAHLLLGHVPQLPYGSQTATYAEFVRRRALEDAGQHARLAAYDAPREHAAETLATLLLDGIRQHELSVPPIARLLHG